MATWLGSMILIVPQWRGLSVARGDYVLSVSDWWEMVCTNGPLSCPAASSPAGAAEDPPVKELPGIYGGCWHPCIIWQPQTSVSGTVLPSLCHLPYVGTGAPHQTKVYHR